MAPCPHCAVRQISTEIEGRRLHIFTDRWIECSGQSQGPSRSSLVGKVGLLLQFAIPLHSHLHHFLHLLRARS